MSLTAIGLGLNALGAVLIAVFEPDPTDMFSQMENAIDGFRASGSSLAAKRWNSHVRPTFEGDGLVPQISATAERKIRLWLGWGLFVCGTLLQILGEAG